MKHFRRNNQGIALITVVIGVMFCLLLSSTMLRVSLLGLQSRGTNNEVSNTFYDAESVIDTIRLNLQHTAAEAWATTSNDTDSSNFVKKTYQLLTGATYPVSSNIDVNAATKTMIAAKLQTNAVSGGQVLSIGELKAEYSETGKLEGLTIKDVNVKYTDPKTGMVSYVKTDITVRAPIYASSKSFPLGSYSMFAGAGATLSNANGYGNKNPNQMGFMEQEGNVYIGYDRWYDEKNADALVINNRETFILTGENVVINGNVLVTDHSALQITGKDIEIRGKIILGPNCHLIVGKNSNIKCQDVRFCANDADVKYNSTNYKSLAGKQIAMTSGLKTYNGLPRDYYNANPITSNPYYSNDTSIVYIDGTKGYDASIMNGTVKSQTGAVLSNEGGFTCDLTDENLYPKKNAVINGHEYDQVFLSVVDVDYFEKFISFSGPKNAHVSKMLRAPYKIEANNKWTALGGYDNSNVSNVARFEYGPGQFADFQIKFAAGNISNPINVGDYMFFLTNLDLQINMDANHSEYCGIFLTPGHVKFKKDNNYCSGRSLLSLDTTPDRQYLKKYIDNIGLQVSDTALDQIGGSSENIKYVTFNNLFKGGIRCFYDNNASQQSTQYSADVQHNSNMNLIDMSNYEKK